MGAISQISILEERLKTNLPRRKRIETLLELAHLLELDESADLSWFKAVVQEAYDLCQIEAAAERPYLSAWADTLQLLSFYYRRAQDDYQAALSYARQALTIYEEIGDMTNQAHSHIQITWALIRQGSYAKAYEHLHHHRQTVQKSARPQHLIFWWRNLGKVYYSLGEAERGYTCLQTAVTLSDNLEDIRYKITCLGSLSYHLRLQNQFQDAINTAHQALQLVQAHDFSSKSALINIYNNLGHAYLHLEQYDRAASCLQQSRALCEQVHYKLLREEMLRGLGQLALVNGQFDTAQTYLQEALSLAKSAQMPEELILCHKALVHLYEAVDNKAQAYAHFRQAHDLEIAQLREKTSQKFQYLTIRHRLELLEQENKNLAARNLTLQELHREKDELLNLVAHNLNNPLTSIQMTLDVLERKKAGQTEEETRRRLHRIRENVAYMTELTAQLLDMERLDKGQYPITIDPVLLDPLVAQFADRFVAQAAKKDIDLDIAQETDEIYVLADKHALGQILENLLSNALKYSLPRTKVQIRLKGDTHFGYVVVQDEGLGLSPNDMEKLFHKYARLSAAPTGQERSIGLGLYITKRMVEMMNGRIWAESKGKGKGSIFTVQLPLAGQMAVT